MSWFAKRTPPIISTTFSALEVDMDRAQRLKDAIFNRDHKKIKLLIRAGSSFTEEDQEEFVEIAAGIGDLEALVMLKESGFDLSADTLFYSMGGEVEGGEPTLAVLLYLLEEMDLGVDELSEALMYAAAGGGLDCVKAMQEEGADLEYVCPETQVSAAENAIRHGHNHILKYLIISGLQHEKIKVYGEISETDNAAAMEMSLLEFAGSIGNVEAVKTMGSND